MAEVSTATAIASIRDPRKHDDSLPHDAVADMKTYGVRVYYSDTYPGFLWRNCRWYKITPDLEFSEVNANYGTRERYGPIIIGDDFREHRVNGEHVFISVDKGTITCYFAKTKTGQVKRA